jgi:hypothetical protein
MKKKILLLIQLALFSLPVLAQSKADLPFYICMSDLDSSTKQTLKQDGYLFNTLLDWYTPSLDETAFRQRINQAFPNPNATGIGVLDWEGSAFNKLRLCDPNNPDFQSALAQYTKAVQIAKSMRPNMKWGYYALPFGIRDANERQWNNTIAPLLQECDVFFPSLYQYYPKSSKTGDDENAYIKKYITEMLRLATKYNKMVMPFVWDRIYVNQGAKSLTLISLKDFELRILNIMNTTYKGKGIDGMVWWSSETYYYKHGNDNMNSEVPSGTDFATYHAARMVKYGNSIKSVLAKN